MSETKRDPRRDPQPGDTFTLTDGHTLKIEERRIRRPNEHLYGLGGNVKDFITYRLSKHPGCVFNMAVSGLKKRVDEVIHAAE